jgi:hypothetical protein
MSVEVVPDVDVTEIVQGCHILGAEGHGDLIWGHGRG